MSDNVVIAIIGGSSIGLSSLLLVYRGFASIERRLEVIEGDLKQFVAGLPSVEHEIAALKERTK
jgi:hypothetical protein